MSRDHLEALSSEIGIFQHAIGARPDPAHGYCTDDVARALEVDLLHYSELGWPAVRARARANLAFLEAAFDHASGRFRNFRAADGAWLPGIGSEDCHGRAILALGSVSAQCPDAALVAVAEELLDRARHAAEGLTALRAMASTIIGCDLAIGAGVDGAIDETHSVLARRLHAAFDSTDPEWLWPERIVTYENALLPRALIVAGRRLGNSAMTTTGVSSLDWLVRNQTAGDGTFAPIGNHWWARGGTMSRYDQQPIEATATIRAAASALSATGLSRHRKTMEQAYAWFLGANSRTTQIVDPIRGAGCDGLTPHGANTNQGAESTLMWLIAAENIRAVRRAETRKAASTVAPNARVLVA